jgi:Family of unknown function (DUF6155)
MRPIDAKDLKRYLKLKSQHELISQIAELFTRFDQVKDFYEIRINPAFNNAPVQQKYKNEIRNAVIPQSEKDFRNAPNLAKAEKAVSDYKRIAVSNIEVAEIYLHYVETVIDFINEFGEIDEDFYESMELKFEEALKLIVKDNLEDVFEKECQRIIGEAEGIGYGSYDDLHYNYEKYFKKTL